jgi:hypothetical protein
MATTGELHTAHECAAESLIIGAFGANLANKNELTVKIFAAMSDDELRACH